MQWFCAVHFSEHIIKFAWLNYAPDKPGNTWCRNNISTLVKNTFLQSCCWKKGWRGKQAKKKSTGGAFLSALPVTSLYQRWWSCTVREMALHALSLSHPKQLTKGMWRFRSAKSSLHHPLHTDPTFNLVGSSFTISSQLFGEIGLDLTIRIVASTVGTFPFSFLVSGCLSYTTPFFTAAGFFIFFGSPFCFRLMQAALAGFFIAGVVTI